MTRPMTTTVDEIRDAFIISWDHDTHLLSFEIAGWQLRDASFEDVEHFFVYNADVHAEMFLG